MKKIPALLSLFLAVSLLLSPAASAAGSNTDTLADWDVRITVPDDAAAAVLRGNTYYIYAQSEGYIPYVMLMATSEFDSEGAYIDYMNEYMADHYGQQNFEISAPAELKTFGDRLCYEVDYTYTISGLEALDRRVFLTVGELTYMFASKEIASRGWTVDGMLEEVVAGCVFLAEDAVPALPDEPEKPDEADAPVVTPDSPEAEPDEPAEESNFFDAYLYCQDDGMPKYWLDLTGALSDQPVLHCYFRSGEPSFYESVFVLDFDTALTEENTAYILDVYDAYGNDVSDWFQWLSLEFYTDAVVLDVERDEQTLAGGAEDNILTGIYVMEPAAAEVSYVSYDEDGEPKYWLSLAENGDVELHGVFSSGGDPETYEDVYVLDAETARQRSDGGINYSTVTLKGGDVSAWFRSILLQERGSAYVLTVKRDDRTLSGGPEENILTGSYLFEPVVGFAPLTFGPFEAEELGVLAQRYYFVQNGFFPPEAEVTENEDGSFTVHLYENVDSDGVGHTATSAWYTVDPFGVGVNDVTGEEVYLAG